MDAQAPALEPPRKLRSVARLPGDLWHSPNRSWQYQQGNFPDHVATAIEHLDIDALSVWRDPRLAKIPFGIGCRRGPSGRAFLEEEVLIAALEGARHGYDIRLLSDLSVARDEGDRSIALTRLAHHGILATTIRRALLEWAVSLGVEAVGRRVETCFRKRGALASVRLLAGALVLGWTAPSAGLRGGMGSSMTSNEGAARGDDCSHRFGHVKERISVAWR